MVSIQEAHSDPELAEVARLAREIWGEYFVPMIGRAQIDYMLEKFQSASAIAGQVRDGYQYFLARRGNHAVGYTAVVPTDGLSDLQLSKIYVREDARGLGIGRCLLDFVEDLCRERKAAMLWLTVNRNNAGSIAWYERRGFTNAGPLVTDIGGGFVMDDYRMEKRIA